jgi:hypothetical protein
MPTSIAANVPTARGYASAVWTGSEMIVWGGSSQGDGYPVMVGGRYDPTTDSWLPISIRPNASSPIGVEHTAVWTGTEMIVWGGAPGTSTGGRYCACPAGNLVYRDADGDGLGNPGDSIGSCDGTAPEGYVLNHTDCNDAIANTSSDFDNDGEGDACDLNDGLIYEWRNDKTSVSWQAEQGPTSWNVYVGDLDVLRATGEYTQAPGSNAIAAHVCGITGIVAADTGIPEPGKVSFSLVTGVTNGSESSLGSGSSGARPNANPCPN